MVLVSILHLSFSKEIPMAEYIPPTLDWVREQVELYEGSGGTEGTTLRDTGMPCIIVTHVGAKTGGIRKIPLMRVAVDKSYVLIGSYGGRPKNPVWVLGYCELVERPRIFYREG
jgi:hypothetical protein